MCGVDPTRLTLREVWWMACGRYDLDVRQRAFWVQAFGQRVTAEQLIDMHPLRRAERPAVAEGDGEAGWAVLGAALKSLNQQRGA
jgi:hypothetical protein